MKIVHLKVKPLEKQVFELQGRVAMLELQVRKSGGVMRTREEVISVLKLVAAREEPGKLNTIDLIRFRAKRMIRWLDDRDWRVPDVIIRNELRMLREAIEKWETEQKEA